MKPLFLLIVLLSAVIPCALSAQEPPRLVLQITIDQLRGDMLERFNDRFGDGGFRLLLDQGSRYVNAHFDHANTVTAVGHATLATGGLAADHGMAANQWFDTRTSRETYCVEDLASSLLGEGLENQDGRSPRNLTSSTVGDELVLASGGRSRVFSVSTKDRSAIIMAGRLGKAYWYSKHNGRFTSSLWYHERLPSWIEDWNTAHSADRLAGKQWDLLGNSQDYVFNDHDDRSHEVSKGVMGTTFPHTLESSPGAELWSNARYTPFIDQMTLEFVERLFEEENIGGNRVTDWLAVSFSATDYVGHAFGPNSLEAEDNLMRLDRTLARLFDVVDKRLDLERVLVVLSSDHGVAPIPEYMQSRGFDAARLEPDRFMDAANSHLQQRFGMSDRLAVAFRKPGIYLDTAKISELALDITEVEAALAEALMAQPGIALALTRSQWLAGQVPDNATTHGSPYRYDSHVPVIFMGPGIPGARIDRRISPADIAPTLSTYLGIGPPSGSTGEVLGEVR